MDNEGWIPISLLASFKRVRQLHTDAAIVREVLSRSAVVEVSGDCVRMGGRQWVLFVLPNAPRSMVTVGDHGEGKSPRSGPYHEGDAYAEVEEIDDEHGEIEGDCDGEDCEGDDEDDDIEFVIGEEAEGSWMPGPERKQ
jgi:la-related protein 1